MSVAQWIVLAVAVQRICELALARRNTARLLAAGGHEVGAGHYPFIVAFHTAWLLSLFLAAPVDPAALNPWFLGAFAFLQVARIWVIATLGRRWTTRIIVTPGMAPVRHGPYRLLRHPNYAIVAAEIAILPLAFGLWPLALTFSALNLPLLAWRVRVEERALDRVQGMVRSALSPCGGKKILAVLRRRR